MYGTALLLHILGATIWTGGHIVLSVAILPGVLRERSPAKLLAFESAYERLGMTALVVQVLTGLFLAYRLLPDIGRWFDPSHPIARIIALKLILLAVTIGLAVHARLRVIPHLSEKTLGVMAWHIIPVTLLSILFVVAGVSFRTGWL